MSYTEDYAQVRQGSLVMAIAYDCTEKDTHPLMTRSMGGPDTVVYHSRETHGFAHNWAIQDLARRLKSRFVGACIKYSPPPSAAEPLVRTVAELIDALYRGSGFYYAPDEPTDWFADGEVVVQCSRPDVMAMCCPFGVYYANDKAALHEIQSGIRCIEVDTNVGYAGLDEMMDLCFWSDPMPYGAASQRFATGGSCMVEGKAYVYPPSVTEIAIDGKYTHITGLWVNAPRDAKVSIELPNGRLVPFLYLDLRLFVCPITYLATSTIRIHTTMMGVAHYQQITTPNQMPRAMCLFGYPNERAIDLDLASTMAPMFVDSVKAAVGDAISLPVTQPVQDDTLDVVFGNFTYSDLRSMLGSDSDDEMIVDEEMPVGDTRNDSEESLPQLVDYSSDEGSLPQLVDYSSDEEFPEEKQPLLPLDETCLLKLVDYSSDESDSEILLPQLVPFADPAVAPQQRPTVDYSMWEDAWTSDSDHTCVDMQFMDIPADSILAEILNVLEEKDP